MGARQTIASVALLMLLTSCGSSSGGSTPPSNAVSVTGRVFLAPTTPNQSATANPMAARKPASNASVQVSRAGDTAAVARATTSGAGRFALQLRPGRYTVTASLTGNAATGTAHTTVVVKDSPIEVVLTLDSGIR